MGEGDDGLAVDADHARPRAPGRARGSGREVPKPALLTSRSTSTPSLLDLLRQRCRLGREVAVDDVGGGRELLRRAARGGPSRATRIRSWPRAASWLRELLADSRGCAVISAVSAMDRSLFCYLRSVETVPRRMRTSDDGHAARRSRSGFAPGRRSTSGTWATPSYPAQRREPEPDSPVRTPFQRDRDRIVHSKAFRRLKHKTQVFVAPEGDHYRTRLTHTLEACFISRTVARALGLNEDLTEAIGLGHDLGHPPFGHIGEEVLDEALREHGMRLPAQRALAAGGGGAGARRAGAQPDRARCATGSSTTRGRRSRSTLEGRVVRIVDRVAYINHDIDDAVRAGIISDGGPAGRGDRAARARRARADRRCSFRTWSSESRGGGRHRAERGGRRGDAAAAEVHVRAGVPGAGGAGEQERARIALRTLFDHYLEHLDEVPATGPGCRAGAAGDRLLAGMTDRFCLATFERLAAAGGDCGSDGKVHERERSTGSRTPPTSSRSSRPTPTCSSAARTHWGYCPFHDERTPSFSVNPRDKLYYCFGCEAGGDVFRFVEEKEGLDFPEAVEALAERYGVEIERESEDPRAEEARRRRARLWRAAGADGEVLRALPVGLAEGGEGAGVPGGAGAGRGGAAAVRRRVWRRAPGTRC